MNIERKWCMPNSRTFKMKPVNDLLNQHVTGDLVIDPFANETGGNWATVTNDIDPNQPTDYHLDALEFLRLFNNSSVDCVLFDPPYSPRQVSECYKRLGRTVTMTDTQSSFWSKMKDEITRIVKTDGVVISFGWNSQGVGKTRGFDITDVLLIAHGGNHNDTICTVERKLSNNER